MRYKICKYINSYAYRSQHDLINTALLKAVYENFKEVEVYTGNSSWEILKKNFSGINKIKFLYVVSGKSKISGLLRYICSAINNIFILLASKRTDILFYNFNNVFSLHGLNFINLWLKRKIIIVCHGELELLISNEGGFQSKIMRFLCRNFYFKTKMSNDISYIVLGDCIIDNLNKLISKQKINHFFSLDHPFIPYNIVSSENQKSSPIKVGTVGELNSYKGAEEYVRLLQTIPIEVLRKVEFYSIGSVTSQYTELTESNVIIPGNGYRLSRSEFDDYVEKLDYILFFYGNDKYKLIASGAIFDAIKYKKSIIALENTYFNYLTNKFGKIGFLCKDIKQMSEVIIQLSESGKNEFDFSGYYTNLTQGKFSGNFKNVISKCL